jgi:hypothetical protein
MAQHGYLGDYDESSYRREDRDRWQDEDRERSWRRDDRYEGQRDRDFMFAGREREGGPASTRFREEDRQWRGTHTDDWGGRDRGRQGGMGGSSQEARTAQRFSSLQDDHYRSWRQRQLEALDREYEDYCREREQQFHRDFDSWRSDRRNQGSNEAEAAETELELTHDRAISGQGNTPSPIGQATLGTNTSENSNPGPGMPSA